MKLTERWLGLAAAGSVAALIVGWVAFERLGDSGHEPLVVSGFPGVDVFSPDYPANGPFPGPDIVLSDDQQRAVEASAGFALAGAQTTVVSVELSTYRKVMCGRMDIGVGPDFPVWLVWFKGPFRKVITPLNPMTRRVGPVPVEPPTKLYVVDARTFQSRQTFAPWPIAPSPKANCPPE